MSMELSKLTYAKLQLSRWESCSPIHTTALHIKVDCMNWTSVLLV